MKRNWGMIYVALLGVAIALWSASLWGQKALAQETQGAMVLSAAAGSGKYCGAPIDVVFIVPEATNLEGLAQVLLLDRSLTCEGETPHSIGVIAWGHSSSFEKGGEAPLRAVGITALGEVAPFHRWSDRYLVWPEKRLATYRTTGFSEEAFLNSLAMAQKWLAQSADGTRKQFVVYVGPAAFDKRKVPYPLKMQQKIKGLATQIQALKSHGITFLAFVHEAQRHPDYAYYSHEGWKHAVGEKALVFRTAQTISAKDVTAWLIDKWQSEGLLPGVIPMEGDAVRIPPGISAVSLTWPSGAVDTVTVGKSQVISLSGTAEGRVGPCYEGGPQCEQIGSEALRSVVLASPPAGVWHWQGKEGDIGYLQWEPPTIEVERSDTALPQDRGQEIEANADIVVHLWGRDGNVSAPDAAVQWHGTSGPCGAMTFTWDEQKKGWKAPLCRAEAGKFTWNVTGNLDVGFGRPTHFSVRLEDEDTYTVFPVSLLKARIFVSLPGANLDRVILRTSEDAPLSIPIHHLDMGAVQWPFLLRSVAPVQVVVGLFDEKGHRVSAESLTKSPDNFVSALIRTPDGKTTDTVVLKYNAAKQWWEGVVEKVPSHKAGNYYLEVNVGPTLPTFYWREKQKFVFRRIDPFYLWGGLWLLLLVLALWIGHEYWCPGCSVMGWWPVLRRRLNRRPWGYVELYGAPGGQVLNAPFAKLPVKCKKWKIEAALREVPLSPYEKIEVKWKRDAVAITAWYRQWGQESLTPRKEVLRLGEFSAVGERGVALRVVPPEKQERGNAHEGVGNEE